jgi:hypothetical protein
MMKRALILALVCIVVGCSSPAELMNDQQVRALSDDQLCDYKNSYRDEYRTDAEIARRGLNCDRYYRECVRRGNQPNTKAMDFCMDLLRENERLRYQEDFDVFGYGGRHYHRNGIGVGLGF